MVEFKKCPKCGFTDMLIQYINVGEQLPQDFSGCDKELDYFEYPKNNHYTGKAFKECLLVECKTCKYKTITDIIKG